MRRFVRKATGQRKVFREARMDASPAHIFNKDAVADFDL
jgi:hypothetical protein